MGIISESGSSDGNWWNDRGHRPEEDFALSREWRRRSQDGAVAEL